MRRKSWSLLFIALPFTAGAQVSNQALFQSYYAGTAPEYLARIRVSEFKAGPFVKWLALDPDSVPAGWRSPEAIDSLYRLRNCRDSVVMVVSTLASYFPRLAPRTTLSLQALLLLRSIKHRRPYPDAAYGPYSSGRMQQGLLAPSAKLRREIRRWYRRGVWRGSLHTRSWN